MPNAASHSTRQGICMEFWAAHGVECLLALLCVAIIGMAIWIWRAIRQLKNAQGQMIEQIGAMRAAVE